MKHSFWIFAVGSVALASFVVVACSSSSGVDTTEYGPPDAGKPDAVYCVADPDCQVDGGTQKCGFPISDSCEARGVCVPVTGGPCAQSAPMCGCNGDTVTTCGAPDGYVTEGPTNGQTPTSVDGSLHCTPGSH
ncbi:MAG: hypothetical protein ACRELY_07795 [Polyangiaceae bacterium]